MSSLASTLPLVRASKGGIEAFATSVAERDLTREHRLFLRRANPALVLEKADEYCPVFTTPEASVLNEPTTAPAVSGAASQTPISSSAAFSPPTSRACSNSSARSVQCCHTRYGGSDR